jgi:hypothetical protein
VAPAATDVGVRHRQQSLQVGRGHTGDQKRLVHRVDITGLGGQGKGFAGFPGCVEIMSLQPHVRAERFHGRHFERVSIPGCKDRGAQAEEAGRVGDGLAVVAGRGGGEARGA